MGPKRKEPTAGPSTAAASAAADASSSGDEAGPAPKKFREQNRQNNARRSEKVQVYEEEGKRRDGVQKQLFVSDQQWIDLLALHIACEEKFIGFLRNPQPDEFVNFDNEWLAAVYLPGRYQKYAAFENWYNSWYNHTLRNKKFAIIQRAREMVQEVIPLEQKSIPGTLSAMVKSDPKSEERRQDLFRFQFTRQKLLKTAKDLTDTQHGLAKSLFVKIREETDPSNDAAMSGLVKELGLLEQVRSSAKDVLSNCDLNKAGTDMLDELLKLVQPDPQFGDLTILPDENKFPVLDLDEDQATLTTSQAEAAEYRAQEQDVEWIAQQIQTNTNMTIDLLGEKNLGDIEPFVLRMSNLRSFNKIQSTDGIAGEHLVDQPTLAKFDAEMAKWLHELRADFNTERFKLNFRDFEKLVLRPEECKDLPKRHIFWADRNPTVRLIIARDNIVHVRRLVALLLANRMVRDEHTEQLKLTLRRMYALLGIVFGVCAEGSILLTIMDKLLEDLAACVIGHVDPKLETSTMHKAAMALHKASAATKRNLSITDFQRMEREHKAREVFGEIAIFYRGAVVLLYAASQFKKSNKVEEDFELWYTGLVNAFSKCGHSSCAEQLQVKKIRRVGEEGVRVGKDPNSGWSDKRWALSTAIKDARLGFPAVRSMVSTNRAYAYGCLYEFIAYSRYHVGHLAFFHYFAHLWHPACRPFRGKSSLIDDITMVEQTTYEDVEASEGGEAMEE